MCPTSKYHPRQLAPSLTLMSSFQEQNLSLLYISVTCAMEAPSILFDNSLTGFVMSVLLCLVRYNNVPTPYLYMDCVFSSTLEISSTFPPINSGVPVVIVIFFFGTFSPNSFSKLLRIVHCPNPDFLPSSLCTI